MDIVESLITAIHNRLVNDATLQSRMGGSVRLYPVWAPPDAEFPYLVHRLDITPLADFSPQSRNTYMLDIWSYSPSSKETLDIREQVMTLLDGWASSTDETREFWLWKQTDGFVADPTENIWHYACQMNMKHTNDAQIGALLKR